MLAGPTAVGKGTVASYIRRHHPEVQLSVSATTRPPRPGEVEGEHYYFVDDAEFDRIAILRGTDYGVCSARRRASSSLTAQQRALPPVRVRVGVQPTFTRYTFALPALIAVSTERADDQMTLTFEAPLRFDLADVQAALPPTVAGDRGAERATTTSSVRFEFIGKVDVRTFREDNNYVVDVLPIAPRGEARPSRTNPSRPRPPPH